ncbi:MAG: hypothetical protein L3J74_13910 [Bacteroidales bacterium]|nr:hypothetical protein [Bacteroidales bacterium]
MNRKLTFLLILSLFSLNTGAQISTVVFNDEFLNNQNNWYISNTPEGLTKIDNGRYLMEGKMLGKAITSTVPVNLEDINNFKISTEITKITGIDDNGFGLVWGSSDPNNEFEFLISGNGQFKVIEWRNGESKDLIPWTFNSGINRWDNSTNRLRIVKKGAILKFYINDYYVARIMALPNFGNKIGFVINETMKISINYLVLEKIEEEFVNESTPDKAVIQSASFNGTNVLRYEESAVLKVIVTNPTDHSIYDLALMISSFDDTNIEYNRITMIEKIPAHDKLILAIVFTAGEEVTGKTRNFELNLVDSKNVILDTKNISLKTVQNSFYTEYSNPDYNNPQNYSDKYNTPRHPANGPDGCTKGCAYVSLAALIAGIILAIL